MLCTLCDSRHTPCTLRKNRVTGFREQRCSRHKIQTHTLRLRVKYTYIYISIINYNHDHIQLLIFEQELSLSIMSSSESEFVFIQETAFNVTIQCPNLEPFEIQVSSTELVQEIHHLLMDREDTCHRTCFSLQFDSNTLDNFVEIKSIEGLKEGSVIKVVEERYTVREARIHLRHVRDLIRSLDYNDAYNGLDCHSLSFLCSITNGDIMSDKQTNRSAKNNYVDCTPSSYILPGTKDRLLKPLHPIQQTDEQNKVPSALKVLTASCWNPPPGHRKLRGDLIYVYVVTNEDRRLSITGSTKGFYLNQSTEEEFNPLPVLPKLIYHSLTELLNAQSPSFKRNFAQIQRRRHLKHPFERVATPYQVTTWCAPQMEHVIDSIRAEDTFSSKLGYEENIPGQTRDWNEELQTTRELPRKTLPERLLRERAIFKVHSDFVAAATRGAMAVVDGNVMAINPGEVTKMQMFIWNAIFFSLGFDVRDHYKELGGDAAAFAAPINDLQGVRAYASVDIEKLYTLGTVVIDYHGMRVTAQSIIPGILEREQEQSVIYGSVDFGKTVMSHPKYVELLSKAAPILRIAPHKVINEKEEEVEIFSSVECKGIIGNDGRHYILDLLRTFPPDVNYLQIEDVELSEEQKQLGYPKKFKHKLCCVRQELLDAFCDSKENSLEIRFNPDVFSEGVRHQKTDLELLKKERDLVVEAARYLAVNQIANFVNDSMDHTSPPLDGSMLVESLHSRGINVRYLGRVTLMLSKVKELDYLYAISLTELISRAVKHVYCAYIQDIDHMDMSAAISHFLNCYLSSCTNMIPTINQNSSNNQNTNDDLSPAGNAGSNNQAGNGGGGGSKKLASKRRGKRKRRDTSNNGQNNDWMQTTPKSLWSNIISELEQYYNYDATAFVNLDQIIDELKLHKIIFLRSICVKTGVQILLREYNFDSKGRPTFNEDDILNVFPIVKHIDPRASDAYSFYTTGQSKIQQGYLKEGHELICESLNLLNHVFGPMHPTIAQCLRMVARLNYIMGDNTDAMTYEQKAVLMSEKVNGIDHPRTIIEYTHLALYCFVNGQVTIALKLLYRARYLLLIVCGENHPEMAILDSNIGLILHAVCEYDLSLRFLKNALKLNLNFFGSRHMKVAVNYHLVARTQSCMADFRGALQNEKETYAIYRQILSADHDKTKESGECLRHLTQQAVVMAKKLNEMNQGSQNPFIPPVNIQRPSMSSVIEMLNIINGIIFLPS